MSMPRSPRRLTRLFLSAKRWATIVQPGGKAEGKKQSTTGPCRSVCFKDRVKGLPPCAAFSVKSGAFAPCLRAATLCAGMVASDRPRPNAIAIRSEEHTSELQSLMRISYAVFCLKKKKQKPQIPLKTNQQSYITYKT